MHNMPDELLTIYEAAERARCHHTTIRRAKNARDIEYIQSTPGAPIQIRASALEAWMKKKTKRALSDGRHGSRVARRADVAAEGESAADAGVAA